MIQKLLHRLFEPRHFWRDVGFDELSELYTSQLLRSLAISLIGLFTPIYLYKLGYSIVDIALFQVGWFMVRPFYDVVNAFVVAKIGPKHSMLLSVMIHVVYLSMILTIGDMRWPLLITAAVGSFAYSLHILAIQVSFSKIKHADHGGKELGYMVVVERAGAVLGPLIGGIIANYYDPRYTVGLAMIALLSSAIPLFLSSEPVVVNQHITFRGLPFSKRKFDYISVIPTTIENVISIIVWPLFIGIFIFTDNTFVKVGAIAALSTLSSIVLGRSIGSIIDRRKGRAMLRLGVVLNAGLHLIRPYAGSVPVVAAINVANEPVTAMYRMPYIKGLYDAADSLPGYRIAYLSSMAAVDACARLALWLIVWAVLHYVQAKTVFQVLFFVAALASLGILLERFEALRPKK